MTARHAASDSRRPGDLLVRLGVVVFLAGLVAVVASVVPSVLSGDPARLDLVVTAGSLLPIGFGLALLGLLRQARTAGREARRERGRRSHAGQPVSASFIEPDRNGAGTTEP